MTWFKIKISLFGYLLKLLPDNRRRLAMNNMVKLFMDLIGEGEFISEMLRSSEKAFKIKESKKYATTEEEIEASLKGFTTLLPYRVHFTNNLRNLRIKNGLTP